MRLADNELRASIELNTPAVLGGARPLRADPYFVLRPSSVRGGLRYWFRAAAASMLWPAKGRNRNEQSTHDARMLEELRKLEAHVFDNTERSSRVVLLPAEGGVVEPWRPLPDPRNQPGLRYLGYGLFESKGRPPDRLITRDGPLELRLRFYDDRPELRGAVTASLWLWTVFGGLGARGRRGYGSMQLVRLHEGDGTPVAPFASLATPLAQSSQEHLARLQRGIGFAQEAITALVTATGYGRNELTSNGERPHPNIRTLDGITNLWALYGETDQPMDALEEAGSLMLRYRSSLARRTPLPDYHAVKQSLQPPYRAPTAVDRAAFGLPLNFYFRSLNGEKIRFLPRSFDAEKGDEPDRLASPLFVRIHALQPQRGQRHYGVTLVNFASNSSTKPLLGCGLRQVGRDDLIEEPSGGILDAFVRWALEETKRQPLQPRRRAQGGRRR